MSLEVINRFLPIVNDAQGVADVSALESVFYEPNVVRIIFHQQNGKVRFHSSTSCQPLQCSGEASVNVMGCNPKRGEVLSRAGNFLEVSAHGLVSR
jgi:hypothetical protein